MASPPYRHNHGRREENMVLHDTFCRCRDCKPPLPYDDSPAAWRKTLIGLTVGALVMLIVFGRVMA